MTNFMYILKLLAITACVFLFTSCTSEKNAISITHATDKSFISTVSFDLDSIVELAPRSDNWVVTWASDDHQYTSWGDGGGFDGDNQDGRVSMGVARIEGDSNSFSGINIWGGKNALTPATFQGKSYGLLAVNSTLWLWKTGNDSDNSAFNEQSLYRSIDNTLTWQTTGVSFTPEDFDSNHGFFAPTFLQFGKAYQGARDGYIYSYAVEITDKETWDVQKPGMISLFRSPKDQASNMQAYEYYSGIDANGEPIWVKEVNERKPVLEDARGFMRPAVNYNKGLDRYFLITQMESRFENKDGLIGLYEADTPWGPWREVLIKSPWEMGLQTGHKSVFWNFSNKWTSQDGKSFVLIYTGPSSDNFGAIKGSFKLKEH